MKVNRDTHILQYKVTCCNPRVVLIDASTYTNYSFHTETPEIEMPSALPYSSESGSTLLRKMLTFIEMDESVDIPDILAALRTYETDFKFLLDESRFASQETGAILQLLVENGILYRLGNNTLWLMIESIPFKYTLQYFSANAILDMLSNGPSEMVALLESTIGTRVQRKDQEALAFVSEHKIVQVLVLRVFQDPIDRLLAKSVQSFVRRLWRSNPSEAHLSECEFLTNYHARIFLQADRFDTYCTLLSLLALSDQVPPWVPGLFKIDWTPIDSAGESREQEKMMVAATEMCCELAASVDYSLLKDLVDVLFGIFKPKLLDADFNPAYHICLEELIMGLSSGSQDAFYRCKCFIDENPTALSPSLFVRCTPALISNKNIFFQENFAGKSFVGSGRLVFDVLLHLIDDETFFSLLSQNILTTENLKRLSQDKLFQVLMQMSLYDYSVQHLLSEMPYLVSTYLVSVNREITNPEVWELKREVLKELIENRSSLLGIWEPELKKCYSEMVNGRKIRDVMPAVDVTDLAL